MVKLKQTKYKFEPGNYIVFSSQPSFNVDFYHANCDLFTCSFLYLFLKFLYPNALFCFYTLSKYLGRILQDKSNP